jgi:hypothetical protein
MRHSFLQITIHRFHGRPPSLFLRAAHAHSVVPGGQNALECSEMHCLKRQFAHQAKLNAHVRLLETKMAVGREDDEQKELADILYL